MSKAISLKLAAFIVVCICLTPLGLLTDFPAWGEWELEEIGKMIGFVPSGMQNGQIFEAPIPDYEVKGLVKIAGYLLSAALGAALCVALIFVIKPRNKNREL